MELWHSKEHEAFSESLDEDQGEALRDLLLLATLADDVLTNTERVDVAIALAEVPGLEVLDFDSVELIDYVDDLYDRHAEEGGLLVADLLERLGEDEGTLAHAFRVITFVMRSHGLVQDEERFARHVAALMGLDRSFVEEVIAEAMNDDT